MSWFSVLQVANGVALREAQTFSFLSDPDLRLARDAAGNLPGAYRSLGWARSPRDLSPIDHDRHIQLAVYVAEMNPLAKAVLAILESLIVGEGLHLKSQRDDCQEVLDAFWDDPDNSWELKQFDRYRQLCVFGELILPAFVARDDGHVKLGYVDPINVKEVLQHPLNAERRLAVILKDRTGEPGVRLPIIHLDETRGSRTGGFLVGGPPDATTQSSGTFFFTINHLTNAARGRSDLLCMFDWLDAYDEFLFKTAERAIRQGDVLWDTTMTGASEPEMREYAIKNPMPQGATERIHNEKVTTTAVSPKLDAHDTFQHARTLRQQVAMPVMIPEGWLYAGSDTNRSTLEQQSEPTYRYLSRRQKQYKAMLQLMGRFAIDQACLAGHLPRQLTPEERWVEVEGSEVSTTDLARVAVTMKDTAAHLLVGQQNQWVTAREAAEVYRRGLAEYGVELDPLPEGAGIEALPPLTPEPGPPVANGDRPGPSARPSRVPIG